MADGDLTTLDKAREICGLGATETGADDILERLITAASRFFVKAVQRPILTTSHTEILSGDGSRSLLLRYSPVVAVQSLAVDGATIDERTSVCGDGWVLLGDTLHVFGSVVFSEGTANVEVTYTAGFGEEPPPDVEQAVLELVQFRFKGKDRAAMASKVTPGGETLSFWGYQQATASVEAVIRMYQQRWVA